MKIMLLSHELPPVGGGGGRAAWELAKRLAAREHDVTILTCSWQDLPARSVVEGVVVIRVTSARSRIDRSTVPEMMDYVRGALRQAPPAVEEQHPDIIHAFFALPAGLVARRLGNRTGIPYVISLRGADVPSGQVKRFRWVYPFAVPVFRRVISDAAAVVALSEGLRRQALRHAPNASIELIPNGVDRSLFHPDEDSPGESESDAAAGSGRRLLYVGRLVAKKNVAALIEALDAVRSTTNMDVALDVVGSGPEEADLRRAAARPGLAGHVSFHGWRERSELPTFYRSADALVLPSLNEGMSNTVLEAMACGLPVIATDVSGTRELLGNGEAGIVVPAGDVDALRDAVVDLLEDGAKRSKLAAAGLQRAGSLDLDAVAGQYESLYAGVLSERGFS